MEQSPSEKCSSSSASEKSQMNPVHDLPFSHSKIYLNIILPSALRESNGKLPLRTFPGCSVPEPYRSPDWALVPAKSGYYYYTQFFQVDFLLQVSAPKFCGHFSFLP